MIFVKRPKQAPPQVAAALAKPLVSGVSELVDARNYYKQKPRPAKAYGFSRYKEFEVCQWLDQLYKDKCAYCETGYSAAAARDVEHYRPKAAVAEAKPHPGYWWLAAHWTNLLPSCPACNQRRRHVIFQPGMTLEQFEQARLVAPKTTSGKANAFPMKPPAKWVTSEKGDLTKEDPLLINPSVRNPAKHLRWVFDWDKSKSLLWEANPLLVAMVPVQVKGADDPYGNTSIAIYGLNRDGLVRTRMAVAKRMQGNAVTVVRALHAAAKSRASPAVAAASVQAAWDALRAFAQPDQQYCGMAQSFLALFDRELTAYLATKPFK